MSDQETKPQRKSVLGKGRSALAPSPREEEPDFPEVDPEEATQQTARNPFAMGFFGALGVLVAIALSQAVLAVQNILVLAVLALSLIHI